MGRQMGWIESKRKVARAKRVITDNHGWEMRKEENRLQMHQLTGQLEGETALALLWLGNFQWGGKAQANS